MAGGNATAGEGERGRDGRWEGGKNGRRGDASTFALPRTRTLVLVKRGGPIVHTSHGC